jgi:hypothetical protein
MMPKTVEGIYRNGRVELLEPPPVSQESRVLVTFLPASDKEVSLDERGIGTEQAANLRAKLEAFTKDWDSPEMGIYDVL